MCKITLNLTRQELNWLKAKLNNEFIDLDKAQAILKKINKGETTMPKK